MFYGCYSLEHIDIPKGVTCIGPWAFDGCEEMTEVKIPDSMTTIEMYAFSGCTGLTRMIIPSRVKEIGEHAFESCTGLEEVFEEMECEVIYAHADQIPLIKAVWDGTVLPLEDCPHPITATQRERDDASAHRPSLCVVPSIGLLLFLVLAPVTSLKVFDEVTIFLKFLYWLK